MTLQDVYLGLRPCSDRGITTAINSDEDIMFV